MSQNQASIEAYSIKKPSIPLCQRVILRQFIGGEELCQADVKERLGIEINQVNPRINELVKMECLAELPDRKLTRHSRIKLTHYRITEKGRNELKPKQTSLF